MSVKIIREWQKEERISAYDTDIIYYAEVEIDGRKQVLSNTSGDFHRHASRIIGRSRNDERKEELSNKFMRQGGHLEKEEAIELLLLIYPRARY